MLCTDEISQDLSFKTSSVWIFYIAITRKDSMDMDYVLDGAFGEYPTDINSLRAEFFRGKK